MTRAASRRKVSRLSCQDATGLVDSVRELKADLEVMEAARYMHSHDVKRVLVIEEGRMVGILSRFDIVAAFTRPDDLIEDEIREDLIRRLRYKRFEILAVNIGENKFA